MKVLGIETSCDETAVAVLEAVSASSTKSAIRASLAYTLYRPLSKSISSLKLTGLPGATSGPGTRLPFVT